MGKLLVLESSIPPPLALRLENKNQERSHQGSVGWGTAVPPEVGVCLHGHFLLSQAPRPLHLPPTADPAVVFHTQVHTLHVHSTPCTHTMCTPS